MCDVLVFSRDRACQLDALLRSLETNGPAYRSVRVLYRTTSDLHQQAYRQLMRAHPYVFDYESGFQWQVEQWLASAGPVVSFLVDDDVFYRRAELAPEPGVCYRLGSNVASCYPSGELTPMPVPAETKARPWRIRWQDGRGDWGYPFALDGNVFAKDELAKVWPDRLDNPTGLEASLHLARGGYPRPWMTVDWFSSLVGIPHNRVTVASRNRISDRPEWSADRLCEAFLDGYRIDIERMDWTGVDAGHAEIPLILTRIGG